ncbi:tetratricopeptide repeat protein [Solwaraspora sp. WMMD1047]|uniref:AfsR/SARP family transcriptional regulator n=1 Tax=Solwaraspora sp. WMMD1047 TaxID=3016102 RepID=UPI0024163D22|nr:tetratricopeptide repeat protein [Solwaraspora sp. WMMD1047]MDG4830089.1 tetratricopeptide repeat protein [Solwaraspora sp. WMMD1047]
MEFRVLGPVEARVDGQAIPLGRPQQRLVLALLLVDAGRLVSTQMLIDRVWETAPAGARRTLHVHITRLRRLLTTAGATMPLVRRSGGYLLDIDPVQVDLHQFRRLVARARDRDSPDQVRAARLHEAIGLWHGEPLAGLPAQWATRTRAAWQQEYLDAVVLWARAENRVGDPATVIGPLSELAAQYPLVEPLAVELTRVLYRLGRTAEALDLYTRTRRLLADELGIDPGHDLQQLHQAILRGDALPPPPDRQIQATALVSTDPPAAAPVSRSVPQQLPAPPRMFTGRVREVAALARVHDASALAISTIDGMAGIGKTALAVHVAHHIVGRYPDGQIFIDLHGYTCGVEPVDSKAALDHALRALGIPAAQIPAGLDERAALYRTRLADKQVLLVLDNAATESQVQPLLPGAPGSMVLVTSRHRLPGLDPTYTLSLDTLPVPDAITLFTRVAGVGQPRDESPDLLIELVHRCGQLPLAIRIAAARLRSHPTWSLTHLVERLRDPQHRLTELEAGQRSVTATLDLSFRHLDTDLQQAYRLLGRHPGPDLERYATAALLNVTVGHADRTLDRLLDAHLLQEPTPGRYRFHDLTRAHAATGSLTESTARAAISRLLDHYRHVAALAMDAAYPAEREHRPPVPAANTPRPELSTPASALRWLDTEHGNLLAAVRHAAQQHHADHVRHLSGILHRHLRTRGLYHDTETLHQQALATARATGNRVHGVDALGGLADIRRLQGRHEEAADDFGEALRIARATGYRVGELTALTGLGHIHRLQGRPRQAAEHYEQALRIARATGHRPGELTALGSLGDIRRRQGLPEQAAEHYRQALRIAKATGHRAGELDALAGLGDMHRLQGRYPLAVEHYEQVLRIARATGHRRSELNALTGLGDLHRRCGRHLQADAHYHELLALARDSGDRNFEFEARHGLGRLRNAAGQPDAAIAHHSRALVLARELGQPADQARAHDGLASAHRALNLSEQARRHWEEALTILTRLGVDHTDEEETTVPAIRGRLGQVESTTSAS